MKIIIKSPMMGDNLVTMGYLRALYEYHNTKIIVQSYGPEFLRFFTGYDEWWQYGKISVADRAIDFSEAWRIGIDACVQKSLNVTQKKPVKMRSCPVLLDTPYVVVSPYASGRIKEIPMRDWQHVIDTLRLMGYAVVVLGAHTDVMKRWERCHYFDTFSAPMTLLALVQHAKLHIGLSSGNSWLAHYAGIDTIKINTFCDEHLEFTPTFQVGHQTGCRNCYNRCEVQSYEECPTRTMTCNIGLLPQILESIKIWNQ